MIDKFMRTITPENRKNVTLLAAGQITQILAAGDKAIIEVRPPKRSDEQNAKLHAMLADVARQKEFNGQKLSIDQWKMVFVSGHKIATGGDVQMAIGLEGEVINLRESTAKMGVKRLASLIEYIQAWAANNGVKFWDERP